MSSVPTSSAAAAAPSYRGKRRATQIAFFFVLILIPALGIFRIDLATASIMILGYPVYLRDVTVVTGLAIVVATAPLLTYSTIGTVWCGWACPQNTVSEWANSLTHRLLGSRANVNVESAGLQVAPSKNKLRNWAILILNFLLVSLVLGIIPLFYFFPPHVVWSLVSFGESAQFSQFMFRLYLVAVALAFVDIALVRYFWCNYVCLYRFGQLLFKTEDALHVSYDKSRCAECAKCNYCRVSCVTGVDPTNMKFFDRCINCGECIDACNRLHTKDGTGGVGLLQFDAGRRAPAKTLPDQLRFALGKLGWHGALFLVGCAVLIYGLTRHAA